MRLTRLAVLGGILVAGAATIGATASHSRPAPAVRREIIAVYLGTEGTDAESAMIQAVRNMQRELTRQASASGRKFILRGVSLEPTVDGGLEHLAMFGRFDEVSVGGNWTNSAVVHYLGGNIGANPKTGIPQVVLLEREVTQDDTRITISPERELARFTGTAQISGWVSKGAPLP